MSVWPHRGPVIRNSASAAGLSIPEGTTDPLVAHRPPGTSSMGQSNQMGGHRANGPAPAPGG
jgi:hypothetical protein